MALAKLSPLGNRNNRDHVHWPTPQLAECPIRCACSSIPISGRTVKIIWNAINKGYS